MRWCKSEFQFARRAERAAPSCRALPPAQEKLHCCVMVGTVVSSPICNELHQIFFGTSFPLNKFVCLEYTLQWVLLTSSWSCAPCPGEIRGGSSRIPEKEPWFSPGLLKSRASSTDSPKLFSSSGLCSADGTSRDKTRIYSLQSHAWFNCEEPSPVQSQNIRDSQDFRSLSLRF